MKCFSIGKATSLVTVSAPWMTNIWCPALATPWCVSPAPGTPSGTLGGPTDLNFTHGTLHPVAARLFLHDHLASRTLQRVSFHYHVFQHLLRRSRRFIILSFEFQVVLLAKRTSLFNKSWMKWSIFNSRTWYSWQFMPSWMAPQVRQLFLSQMTHLKKLTSSSTIHQPPQSAVLQWKLQNMLTAKTQWANERGI